MKRRRKHIGCSVLARKGYLRLRFRWEGKRYARVTKLPDTAENRTQLQKLANLIAATIAAGKNPLSLFERPTLTGPKTPDTVTVRGYFERWIEDKVPPMVRKAQERDYRRHIEDYVLPELGDIAINELSPRDVLGLRAQLLKRGLSLKYVKNILAGSFKAMIRDAREIDQVLNHDPFVGVRWGRIPVPGPQPFSADERTRILRWFERKRFGFHCGLATEGRRMRPHPYYHVLTHTLFWTGMRPSEAVALRVSDLDLDAGVLRVVRSRHMYLGTCTKRARRRPRRPCAPSSCSRKRCGCCARSVFINTMGRPVEPKTFSTHWYRCLRALGIRVCGIYAMKDTYISTALTAGVNTAWLEAQTGVRYETLRRHYGKWVRTEGADQLKKMAKLDPQLDPRFGAEPEAIDFSEEEKCEEGDLNPPKT